MEDGKAVRFDGKHGSYTQKSMAAVRTAEFLSRLGLSDEFVFFRSERINGKWVFRDSKGNLHNAPNGMYTGKDGRIYIDLNAFVGSRGATPYTLAHELTHFIENNAPGQYKVLADFLINEYDKTGKSMDERVKDKQKELEYLENREISYDEAFREVVADSMQKLFNDGNLQNELVKLKQSSPEGAKVVQAIKDFLDKLIKRIRNIYAKLATGSTDAEAVAQMGESLQKLQKIFAAALVEASDNYTAYGTVDSGTVQMQARQDTASGYGGIREVLAKKGLDELSKKFGDRFPLSAALDATMRADKTPLVMETVLANGVQRAPKESAFATGKRAFRAAYGSKTSVHIKQMGIDADLYVDVAKESIDKAQGKPDEQSTLDAIPHICNILENSILMGMERIDHTDNKGTVLYGYRLYNLYWYQNGNKKTPNCLVCTVVQNLDKAEGYVFQNIENVTVRHGLPGENTGMPEPSNGNIYTVSQLYDAVKKIDRENGGLKYSDVQRDKYLFNYTERNDGVSYQARPSEETSNRYLLANALESAAQTEEER